ncbi:hypothetical protein MRX96_048535 [Rhipicephalus microplus]
MAIAIIAIFAKLARDHWHQKETGKLPTFFRFVYTAIAMEKVIWSAALVRMRAEKECLTLDEMSRMLRSRLSIIERLHGFKRVTGVVEQSVTCVPPLDGCSLQFSNLTTTAGS